MTNEFKWYQLPAEEVFNRLNTGSDGLNHSEAVRRLNNYGPNELEPGKPSVLKRFLRQFNNPLVYVLLVAAAITGALTLRDFLQYSAEGTSPYPHNHWPASDHWNHYATRMTPWCLKNNYYGCGRP